MVHVNDVNYRNIAKSTLIQTNKTQINILLSSNKPKPINFVRTTDNRRNDGYWSCSPGRHLSSHLSQTMEAKPMHNFQVSANLTPTLFQVLILLQQSARHFMRPPVVKHICERAFSEKLQESFSNKDLNSHHTII
jgi:hypothetical protein